MDHNSKQQDDCNHGQAGDANETESSQSHVVECTRGGPERCPNPPSSQAVSRDRPRETISENGPE
jgi:hypothetical protein